MELLARETSASPRKNQATVDAGEVHWVTCPSDFTLHTTKQPMNLPLGHLANRA